MISWHEILIRLALASLFGAIIGIERERKFRVAGLRTHMIVSLGSCLAMIISVYGFPDVMDHEKFSLDPSRIAAQVITGIGFIGAGTIIFLREQSIVRGLTTAAGLWTTAVIGLATGTGMYFTASVATALAIVILFLLQPVEKIFGEKFQQKGLKIVITNQDKTTHIINKIFLNPDVKISECHIDKTEKEITISVTFKKLNKSVLNNLRTDFQPDENIKEVIWTE